MRGPIDYIVVGFEGNKFDGSILKALSDALDKGTISLVALSVVTRDNDDKVSVVNVAEAQDQYLMEFTQKYKPTQDSVDEDDVSEVADLIEKNSTAGLLVIEHLWAKPLKEAILKANGVLLAEGRIHPDAEKELNN